MNDAAWQKVGGVAGIVFGVLVLLAFGTLGSSPEFADEREKINQFFVDNEGKLFGTAIFAMLAGFALAWFANALREAFGGAGGRLIAIGGTIAAAAYALSGSVLAVGAQRVSEHGTQGAESAFINYDLFIVFFGAAAPIGLAVLLSGAAAAAVRGAAPIPAWLGWVSLVLAVVGLVPPISWVLPPLFAVWSILVGVLLLRARRAAAA